MAQILCFGDSITYGMWDSQGGWVTRLRTEIDKQIIKGGFLEWHEVFNLGISGDTTTGVLGRCEAEIKQRLIVIEDCLVVFGTGINDTFYRQTTGKPESTPARYGNQLKQLSVIAAKYTDRILYLGLTPVDESLTQPLASSSSKKVYQNQRIVEFDKVLEQHCMQADATYVPLFNAFTKAGASKLLSDGIHPNDAGHKLITKAVAKQLQQYLG